jgi:hypothetical protein
MNVSKIFWVGHHPVKRMTGNPPVRKVIFVNFCRALLDPKIKESSKRFPLLFNLIFKSSNTTWRFQNIYKQICWLNFPFRWNDVPFCGRHCRKLATHRHVRTHCTQWTRYKQPRHKGGRNQRSEINLLAVAFSLCGWWLFDTAFLSQPAKHHVST